MGNIQSEIVQMNINGVSAEGYLSKPGNLDSEAPGIVVIQEWWGLDDHIKSITERFAEQGFIALAPDLFHGSVTTEPDEAMKLTQAMDQARAREEIDACVAYIQNSEDSSGKVGVVGYCLGGGLSIQSACENSNISLKSAKKVNYFLIFLRLKPYTDNLDRVNYLSCSVV